MPARPPCGWMASPSLLPPFLIGLRPPNRPHLIRSWSTCLTALDFLLTVRHARICALLGRGSLDELESLPGSRRRLGPFAASHLDGRDGKPDAVLVEGPLDQCQGPAANDELLAGLGRHLEADLDTVIAELLDALHLERLDDMGCELGILRQVLADLLDQLLRLVEVGVVGHADGQLVDDPVAAHVLHRPELPVRDGEDRTAMVPQLHRAEAELLHGALVAAALDVLADPEGVVEQVEDP